MKALFSINPNQYILTFQGNNYSKQLNIQIPGIIYSRMILQKVNKIIMYFAFSTPIVFKLHYIGKHP